MIRAAFYGTTYVISIGQPELWAFCLGRPGSGLEGLKGLRIRFETESGRRVELHIQGECDAAQVDAAALTTLVNGMREHAEAKLGLNTGYRDRHVDLGAKGRTRRSSLAP